MADNETGNKDFSKYGQPFQLKTVFLFVKDKAFRNKVKDILKVEYFDNKYLQWIFNAIQDTITETSTCPDFDDLKAIIETKVASPSIYLRTLDNIKAVTLENKGFVETEVVKFCFSKFALIQNERERNHILTGDFEKAKLAALETYKAHNAEINEFDLKKNLSQLFDSNSHVPVPTPFPTFNNIMKGGPGAGDLVIALGQSGFGKSNFAVAYARHVVMQGKPVAYFSLETNVTQLASRFVAGLVDINQEHLAGHPELIQKKVDALGNDIRFIQIKATQAKIDFVKEQILNLHTEGFFPELIIIDSLNQCKLPKGTSFGGDNNSKFEYLAEEIRDLGNELKIPFLALFQMNRANFNKIISDEQAIGKAIEVFQVADIWMSFNQSIPQQEIQECNVTLLKNRLGPKGCTLRLKYDPNRCKFIEIEEVKRTELLNQEQQTQVQSGLNMVRDKLQKRAAAHAV